ncbi:MAG: hypothetical protein WCO63_03075 [Bacteroidota bacterium]
MNKDQQQANLELLQTEWELLIASVTTLQLSVTKCQLIGKKNQYSFEELESFDSLTSKFSRTSDIFTQKVLRTIWMLLHEPFVPFIDSMNKAEKMSLLLSADQMIEIRDLRNEIAHEYIPDAIHDLVPDTIELTAVLFENISVCQDFLMKRSWIR